MVVARLTSVSADLGPLPHRSAAPRTPLRRAWNMSAAEVAAACRPEAPAAAAAAVGAGLQGVGATAAAPPPAATGGLPTWRSWTGARCSLAAGWLGVSEALCGRWQLPRPRPLTHTPLGATRSNPLATRAVTAAALNLLGDVICQARGQACSLVESSPCWCCCGHAASLPPHPTGVFRGRPLQCAPRGHLHGHGRPGHRAHPVCLVRPLSSVHRP